jgi:hypothetical protein
MNNTGPADKSGVRFPVSNGSGEGMGLALIGQCGLERSGNRQSTCREVLHD